MMAAERIGMSAPRLRGVCDGGFGVKAAIGFKCHSGWAVCVALGRDADGFRLLARRRVDLIEPADSPWAKAPYHAAEDLDADAAHALVQRALRSARAASVRALRDACASLREDGHDAVACAILTGAPMPDWTTEQIRAVHVRMHKAEGAIFAAALMEAASVCKVPLVAIVAKELPARAEHAVAGAANAILARLGKSAGPPWGADQKSAALAAAIALGER
jgi:hypothetical protein